MLSKSQLKTSWVKRTDVENSVVLYVTILTQTLDVFTLSNIQLLTKYIHISE